MVQAYFNSELKWGRYDRMKQGCAKCMATQWCQLWAEIAASSSRFLEANHIWFWSSGSQKSNASNGSQFGVETRGIWLIEEILCKEHVVTGLLLILFGWLGWILGLLLGSIFLWQLGHLGFLFSLTQFLVIWILSKL